MTTVERHLRPGLVANSEQTIGGLRHRLAMLADTGQIVDSVTVVDRDGFLVSDVSMFDIVTSSTETILGVLGTDGYGAAVLPRRGVSTGRSSG